MKQYLTICLAFGLLLFFGQAQDTPSSQGTTSPGAEAQNIATANAAEAAYGALLKRNLELDAQFNLLSNLAQEHRRLSEQATKANQAEKALWEDELAKDLSNRSSSVLKQLNEVTKQRLALEKAQNNAGSSVGSLNAALTANRLNPHEPEFLSKIDERLQRLDQEMLTARQDATAYATQISTNTAAYDFERAAYRLDQNTLRIRQLERERFDLELRRLEFLALRKP
jgi:hypothetical protein